MTRAGKVFHLLLAVGVVGLAVWGIWLAAYLPVYADEVGYRIISARYSQDGGVSIYLFPHCSAGFRTPVPLWMVPFRLAEELIYSPQLGLLHIRAVGVGLHLVSVVATVALLLRRAWFDNPPVVIAAALAFFGLGVLPFAAVMNRPDVWIRSAVLVWALLPLGAATESRPPVWRQACLLGLVVVIPAAAIASMHLKAVLFFPLAVGAMWMLVPAPLIRAAGLLILAMIAASTCSYWMARLACPEFPALDNLFGQGVTPGLLFTRPVEFIGRLITNVLAIPSYWNNILFQDRYISDWLPGAQTGSVAQTANVAIKVTLWAMIGVWLSTALLVLMRSSFSMSIDRRSANVGLLSCGVLAVAGVSIPKYFIESPLMLPLIGALCWLSLELLPRRMRNAVGVALFATVISAFLLSQPALFQSYATRPGGSWSEPGYSPRQFISFNYSAYADTRRRVAETAKLCGIDIERKLVRPVVDGLTYPAVVGSLEPFDVLWTGLNWPGPPKSQFAFLRAVGSAGAVAACHLMPPSFAPYVLRNESMCCVPAFETLPEPPS